MKINEIDVIGTLDDDEMSARDLANHDLSRATKVGGFDDIGVYSSENGYLLGKDNQPIGTVSAEHKQHPTIGKYAQIGFIWISPDHRDQGVGTKFYKFILDDQHIAIETDSGQTAASVAVWTKLVQQYEGVVVHGTKIVKLIKSFEDYNMAYDDQSATVILLPIKRTTPIN